MHGDDLFCTPCYDAFVAPRNAMVLTTWFRPDGEEGLGGGDEYNGMDYVMEWDDRGRWEEGREGP